MMRALPLLAAALMAACTPPAPPTMAQAEAQYDPKPKSRLALAQAAHLRVCKSACPRITSQGATPKMSIPPA